jgi:hypothetical protein
MGVEEEKVYWYIETITSQMIYGYIVGSCQGVSPNDYTHIGYLIHNKELDETCGPNPMDMIKTP